MCVVAVDCQGMIKVYDLRYITVRMMSNLGWDRGWEESSSKHNCNKNQGTTIFQPKNGYGFSSVGIDKFCKDPVTIWKSNNDSIYSNNVVFNKYKSKESEVLIYLTDGSVKKFVSFLGGNWTELDLSEITTVGISIESMDDSFAYTNVLDKAFRIFRVRDGFIFNGLYEIHGYFYGSSKYSTVWEATNEPEYADKIIVDGVCFLARPKNAAIYLRNGTIKHYSKRGSVWVERVSVTELDISSVKETCIYSNKLVNDVRTFEARDGYAFNVVNECLDGNKFEVWKTDKENEYANKIVNRGKKVTIHLANGSTKVIEKGSDGTWTKKTETFTPKTGVDLNIKSYKSSRKFDCKKVGQYVTYTPKGNNAFKLVKEDKTELWQASDASEYSDRVEVDLLDAYAEAVTVYLDDMTKVFKKDGSNKLWKEIDTSILNPVSFNIDYPYETHFYTNIIRGNFRTYSAKTGFVFNGANEYVDGKKVEIWKTDNETEYGNKIEVDLMNNDSKAVTIYFPGNMNKLFMKYNKNDPWTEIDITKIKPMLVDITDDTDTYFYSNDFDNNVRTYIAKKGFLFNHVKCGNTDIWTTSEETEYATKVEYAKRYSGILDLTIHLVNWNKKLFIKEEANNPWKEIDITILHPKSVNIDYEHETHSFTNELKNNIRTFTPKPGFTFNCANDYINDRKVDIWKTNKESEYSNKIVIHPVNNFGGKALTIHLDYDKTKVFIKSGKNDPWNEIDTTEVNPKSVNIQEQYDSYFYYNKLDNGVKIFTAKTGFSFNLVKDDNTDIWTTNKENKYSNKVVTKRNNMVIIYIGNEGTPKVFNKVTDDKWTEDTKASIEAATISFEPESSSSAATNYSKTHIYLDITSDTSSTNEFDYKKDGRYISYTAKGNRVFKLVKEGGTNIWEASDASEYSDRVEVDLLNNDAKAVTAFLGDDKSRIFIRSSTGKPWDEFDTSKVNAKTININFPCESYFYLNELQGNTRTFTAKKAFAFKAANEYVNGNAVEIWKTANGNEYANKIVNEGGNKVTINIGDNTAKVFNKGSDGTWKEDITGVIKELVLASSTQPRVKLFKANPSDDTKFLELSANECTSSATGSVVSYHIAKGVNCVQLMFDGVLLWAYDSAQYGDICPESIYHDTNTDVLVLRFQGLDLTFENTNEGWIFTESGPLAVKFHVVDPKDNNNTVELDSTQFTVTDSDDVTTFTIADGVDCIALTYGPDLLWQHDPNERGGIYPKSLDFTTSTETLVLKFDDLYMTFLKNDQGVWEYTETDTSGSGSVTTVPPLRPSSTQSRVKLLKVNPSDAADFVELDANECTSSATGSVVSYHIAKGVNCVQLMFDGVLLWAYDSAQYGDICPESIYHDTNTDVLVLRFQGLDLTFENTNEGWIFTESGPLAVKFHVVDPKDNNNAVELDSTQFTVTDSDDVTTFTIADGVDCIALTYGPDLLWQHDPNERGGIYPKSLDFTTSTETLVLKFDDLYMTFLKNDQGVWEYTETDTSGSGSVTTVPPLRPSSTQSRVKLLKVNPSDAADFVELDANECTSSATGSVVSYHIAKGVNCVQLMFDGVLLWAYDSAQYGDICPESIYHDTNTDVLVLRFQGLDLTFENTNEGWIFTESGPLAVKFHVVDPKDNNNTVELDSTQFTVTDSDDVTTFTIADGVDCIALTYGPDLLWQHDPNERGGIYPKSLDFTTSTETLVLKFDDLYMTFLKNDQGVWEYTETDTSGG
ncbi:hypothetical protein MACJ_000990 [Theileria orientalis]|uniref:Uncharacterized protein n=1 Tax=Theileria orientalis TaxID=68886 RepID=A0A976M988_THEOR|nr:hypothetical protein MACJ_000990 [Theileria orientalis]